MNNVIEIKPKPKRGGAGRGQGAKLKHGEPTKTIRLPISLVDKINQGLIDIVTLSKAKDIVTDSNDSELQKEIKRLNAELAAAKTQILELLSVENKVFYFTWNDIPRKLKKGVNYWEFGDDKEGARFFPVQFIHDDLITHEGGAWFIELENQKIEMTTTSDQQEIKRLNEKYSNLLNHNEKLVIERDLGKVEIQKLKNIVQGIDYQKIADKRTIEELKKELEETRRKLFAGTNRVCQCVTSNGTQCTRTADKLIRTNELMIWTCKQHRAKYPNATRVS